MLGNILKYLDGMCDVVENKERIGKMIREEEKEQRRKNTVAKMGGKFKPRRQKQTFKSFYETRKVERVVQKNQKQLRLLRNLRVIE
jgi:hypothetical protein